jgi:hypothetical protein
MDIVRRKAAGPNPAVGNEVRDTGDDHLSILAAADRL